MSCSYYSFRSNSYYCNKKSDYVNDDVYYKYCRGYDYSYCPIYKNEDSSGGCYLTSACVYAKGLPDDCYELTTLRAYRDNWLANQPEGKTLIEQYYAVAPKIVSVINDRADRASIYDRIYNTMVRPCVELIEKNRMDEALEMYTMMTKKLQEQYG